ncbi:MAG: SsrA-binding protein SmpB [Chloroflexi bacterium]|nr:SsrA-binding protein SmpB [Chloroflexota bacterium]MCI0855537.1 SsrA-binding protein SmpB [Chloroflexota bacterium]MCI0889950.1 SsrA-binding protein SmpB [Chloroflexota bacterium]
MAVKQVAVNKKAWHDYEVLKQVEAGLALLGSEIKSIREGRVQIREAYARPEDGEFWLIGAHIAQYAPAGSAGHEPTRKRKLLLHKSQIRELSRAILEQGLTVIPLRLYLKDGIAKVEIALVRGKKRHDKRAAIAKRDAEREMARAVRRRQ